MAYWEQEGVNLQLSPSMGEMAIWYARISATRTLATNQISRLEELPYRRLPLAVAPTRRGGPGDYYDVDVLRQLLAVLAVYFADVAFNAVTHHGPADFTRHGAPHFPSLACLPDPIADERLPDVFLTGRVNT